MLLLALLLLFVVVVVVVNTADDVSVTPSEWAWSLVTTLAVTAHASVA